MNGKKTFKLQNEGTNIQGHTPESWVIGKHTTTAVIEPRIEVSNPRFYNNDSGAITLNLMVAILSGKYSSKRECRIIASDQKCTRFILDLALVENNNELAAVMAEAIYLLEKLK